MDEMFQLGWLAKEEKYVTSDFHRLIGTEDRPGVFSLDNIGENGKNLTIAVLSMNRSSLTIRLMKSVAEWIPHFEGKILIGDNGSSYEELKQLKIAASATPFDCKIIEFGQNFGVAGGRNRLFRAVETDWLMSLDNDLYFTSNPLPQAMRDINRLGVQFLGLPLVNKENKDTGIYGGHLFLEALEGRPAIGIGSSYRFKDAPINMPADGFLCTGLAGTAAIINKHSFFQAGGFDEGMFVGFEDTEYSVRLFQKGYKVGCCGMISLEHDHPKAEKSDDKQYEKKRFSNEKLYEAALHFEEKHGFSVWNRGATEGIVLRQKETTDIMDGEGNKRTKIALVVDRPNWAFDHVADQIIRNLSPYYDFIRIYNIDIENCVDIFMLTKNCQILHFLWRGLPSLFNQEYCQRKIRTLGYTKEEFLKKYVKGKVISTEVYDHLLLEGPESDATARLFADSDSIITNYAVSSNKLWKIYNELPNIRLRPQAVLADGVDLGLFVPQHLERLEASRLSKRTIRFGWVGNSKWSTGDLKGISTIIRPAIEKLQQQGYNIELYTSDRQQQMIPHHEMPNFYAQIDCYLCASTCEGTPNPILEAMACGVPVITTDVGLVPDVFGPKQKAFVLEERSVECMMQTIQKLLQGPELFVQLSEENQEYIKDWDWTKRTQNFKGYFEQCLEQQVKHLEK